VLKSDSCLKFTFVVERMDGPHGSGNGTAAYAFLIRAGQQYGK
jgi:hypothetical protein